MSRDPLGIGGPKSHGRVDSEPLCPRHHYFLWKPCLLEQWRLARSFTSHCVWHGLNSKGRLRATGPLIHCWWEFKVIQSLWKTIWHFLANLHIVFPYNRGIVLLGVYPVDLKRCGHTKTCMWMFRAPVFLIIKNWKELRCPSRGEWINCGSSILRSISQEFFKNELSSCQNAWWTLKLLSERSQSRRPHIVWFQFHTFLEKAKLYSQ